MDREGNLDRLRSELDELHKNRSEIDRLIERKRLSMLKALPAFHGFESMDALIGTLVQFASKELRDRVGASSSTAVRSRKGVRYPAELRVAVRNALEAGQSASEVARAKGMSLATLLRWKKLWRLDSPHTKLRRPAGKPIEPTPSSEPTVGTPPINGGAEDWAL